MDRLKVERFINKLDYLLTNFPVFEKFVYSILVWEFKVLWKIDKTFISRIIQAFSQSLYTHTAFCIFEGWELYTLGAENFKWVKLNKVIYWKEKALYVIKTFDINEVMKYFDKNIYASNIFYFLGSKCSENFLKRYELFYNYFQQDKFSEGISLWDLIQFDWEFEKFNDLLQLKVDLQKLKYQAQNIVLSFDRINNINKLFFTWWMFKFIVYSYGERYDLWGVLKILFSPFRKNIFLDNGKLFCSEFVSSAMLYGWFYPFDVLTKSPEMITPWDLMDPTFWIWKNSYLVVNSLTGEKYEINSILDAKKLKKLF